MFFLTLLSACETLIPGTYLSCPTASFLAGTEQISIYENIDNKDNENFLIVANMENLASACSFSSERAEIVIVFDIKAETRIRDGDNSLSLPFFLAILDKNGEILSKTSFNSQVPFGNKSMLTWTEELEQEIFLIDNSPPHSFEILIGFQVTEEQLEDNLSKREN